MIRLVRTSLLVAAIIVGLGIIGCGDDLYGECTIQPEPGDSLEACLSEDESRSVSCVVVEQRECQTGACGRYQGSAPFCTTGCSTDDDCPAGECREFVFQSGQNYCVAYEELD